MNVVLTRMCPLKAQIRFCRALAGYGYVCEQLPSSYTRRGPMQRANCYRFYTQPSPKDGKDEHSDKVPHYDQVERIKNAIAHPKVTSYGIDKRVWPIAASTLVMGASLGIIVPVMPMFARDLGLAPSAFGMIISVMGLTRVLSNIPLAAVCDRLGRRPMLVLGPILTSLAMVGTGLSNSLSELIGWRFVTGFSGAAQITGAQLYLSDISTAANRARTLAPMMAAWSAGGMIGPAMGGLIAEGYGLQAPFYVVSAGVAAVAVNNYLRLPETQLSHEKAYKKVTTLSDDMRNAITQWKRLFQSTDIQSIMTLQIAFWLTWSGSQMTLFPLLASSSLNLGPGDLGIFFAVIAGCNVLLSTAAAHLSDHFGRKWAMVPGTLIVAAAILCVPFATSYQQMLSCVVGWGLGNSVFGSAPTAFIADITDETERSQALAMLRTGADIGMMLGAGLMGVLADVMNLESAMIANAIALACVSLLFAYRAREPKRYASTE